MIVELPLISTKELKRLGVELPDYIDVDAIALPLENHVIRNGKIKPFDGFALHVYATNMSDKRIAEMFVDYEKHGDYVFVNKRM